MYSNFFEKGNLLCVTLYIQTYKLKEDKKNESDIN